MIIQNLGFIKGDASPNWNISGFSWNLTTSISADASNPQAIFFKPDGTLLYILDNVGAEQRIIMYSLSTPWLLSSMGSSVDSGDALSQVGTPTAFFFKPDGTGVFIIGTDNTIYQYSLSTAWDTQASSMSYDVLSKNIAETSSAQGIFFKPDGTKIFILDGLSTIIYQYSMSTPWLLSSASYDSLNYTSGLSITTGLSFSPKGNRFYTINAGSSKRIREHKTPNPWSLSGATYNSFELHAEQDSNQRDLFFKPDGSTVYAVGSSSQEINEYS